MKHIECPVEFDADWNPKTIWRRLHKLDREVRILTFQTWDVVEILRRNGVYRVDINKTLMPLQNFDYLRYKNTLGYVPVFVFHPLPWCDFPYQMEWEQEWFEDSRMWEYLLYKAGLTRSNIKDRFLLEFGIPGHSLYQDPCIQRTSV